MAQRHILDKASANSLLRRLEEVVVANSGEDSFEEILKLLLAKIWDERTGRKARFVSGASSSETSEGISGLLAEVETRWPGVLKPGESSHLRPDHLTTCVRLLQDISITSTDLSVLDAAFEMLVSRSSKGEKGQYFTPRYVVDFCVRMTNPTINDRIVDPACGSGAFLLHSLRHFKSGATESEIHKFAQESLWGFDFDFRAVRIAKAMLYIATHSVGHVFRVNSLLKPASTSALFEGASDARQDSMLTIEDIVRSQIGPGGVGKFDVVLTNPPFAGEIVERQFLDTYPVPANVRKIERDALFLLRCVELLRPGGRLAIVLPHNKFAGRSYDWLRQYLLERMRVVAVVGLGRNTFLPHTHQKTSVLLGVKRERNLDYANEKVLFAISERDGKDKQGELMFAAGSETRVDTDLDVILDELNEFRSAEKVVW